ncbi:30S ribosomal protein S2 [Halogeometricum borinquense]|uniref:Small ribosomal subunit protein uS2 n=2 Tax=Halogeometricum borinquense TaxID=60847 RepID=E4NRP8_HALBP|nr:30S ribosomal protein S2 [Halogeometricum borinquense]ADQ66835.1 SSU ribosomal protein S2P [Halogeometricum borinquense DSM 11551]ELY30343.1 30S ribosomal protein S2 [Halogeometricum borinquense DSM 11551]QIB74851.1 30S ribosomal protein S2 [Halogeometricum borinquense]QIQ76151.1 30S ribosomal protein S2 [Halogeometricum borinquense]RYJ14129.1 30S ribosomal protein S2 [Halogeometricum borinquense]
MTDNDNEAVEVVDDDVAEAEAASDDSETAAAETTEEEVAEATTADAADEEAAEDEADAEAAEEEPTFDEDVMPDEEADLLIPVEDYLGAGVHIGTQQKTNDMERFIHRVRDDGLYVLDVSQTDSRIRTAADFLAGYDPEQILVTSSRQYGRFPAKKFADAVGARARTGRFIPGTLTNPDYAGYIEPDVVVVTDPIGDSQAVKEAITVGIPVIAMCDSNNQTSNVDLVVPTNNKGRRALSVVYWLLANETLDRRGTDQVYALEDFEAEV